MRDRISSSAHRWRAAIYGAAALASLSASPSAQALDGLSKPDKMTTLHYASTGQTWSSAPQIVATVKGFYKEENVELQLIVAGQSAAVCQQILARAVEFGQCSLNDVIQVVEASGAPLVQVSNEGVTALNYAIMAKSNIKSWADMKGKTIIVSTLR